MKRKILMLFQKIKYVFIDHNLLIKVTKTDLNSFRSCFWANSFWTSKGLV